MSIKIKTAEEIERMRIAGKLAAEILEMIEPHIQVGVTTDELNKICHEYALEKAHTLHRLITMVSLSRFVRLSTILFVTVFLLKKTRLVATAK